MMAVPLSSAGDHGWICCSPALTLPVIPVTDSVLRLTSLSFACQSPFAVSTLSPHRGRPTRFMLHQPRPQDTSCFLEKDKKLGGRGEKKKKKKRIDAWGVIGPCPDTASERLYHSIVDMMVDGTT